MHHADGADPACLDASGRAGSGADAGARRAEGWRAMPADDDIRAVTVPGCVDGWTTRHSRFGRLPFADVVERVAPAIGDERRGDGVLAGAHDPRALTGATATW